MSSQKGSNAEKQQEKAAAGKCRLDFPGVLQVIESKTEKFAKLPLPMGSRTNYYICCRTK